VLPEDWIGLDCTDSLCSRATPPGTSFACPLVAGSAAQILGIDAKLDPATVIPCVATQDALSPAPMGWKEGTPNKLLYTGAPLSTLDLFACKPQPPRSPAPPPPAPPAPPDAARGKSGCFASESMYACRLLAPAASAEAAYTACYGEASGTTAAGSSVAERTRLAELVAGDLLLTVGRRDSRLEVTRVIVNQHARADVVMPALTLHLAKGALSCTPDHALFLDSALRAASEARVGSVLMNARGEAVAVTSITRMDSASVVNPITTTGTLLVSDEQASEAIVAASHPIWIAAHALDSRPRSLSLCNALSFLFPKSTQTFYDTLIEPASATAAPALVRLYAQLPNAATVALVAVSDVVLAVGFAAFGLLAVSGKLILTILCAAFGLRVLHRRSRREGWR